jgi:hypothetical protein
MNHNTVRAGDDLQDRPLTYGEHAVCVLVFAFVTYMTAEFIDWFSVWMTS